MNLEVAALHFEPHFTFPERMKLDHWSYLTYTCKQKVHNILGEFTSMCGIGTMLYNRQATKDLYAFDTFINQMVIISLITLFSLNGKCEQQPWSTNTYVTQFQCNKLCPFENEKMFQRTQRVAEIYSLTLYI